MVLGLSNPPSHHAATIEALSRRELKLQDAVARANYCLGAGHEELQERFHELLLLV